MPNADHANGGGLRDGPARSRRSCCGRAAASSTDEIVAKAVSAWRERFADFDATAEAVAAEPGSVGSDCRNHQESRRRPVGQRRAASRRATLWDNIRFWRAAGISGRLRRSRCLMVIVIGALVTSRQIADGLAALSQRKPVYVAVLVNDATKEAGAIVNAFSDGRVELIPLRPIDVPAGRTLQIWTLVGSRRRPEIGRPHRSVARAAARSGVFAGDRARPIVRDYAGA